MDTLVLIQTVKEFISRILLNSRHFYFVANVLANRNMMGI